MERFRSKIDTWLLAVLVVAIAAQILVLVAVMSGDTPGFARAVVLAVVVPGVLLMVSVVLRTHYTVSDGKVRIVAGPFASTISISEITDITESRSGLQSPALSLDRLKISYGHNKRVLVSPVDKKGFLRAIEKYAT